MARSLGVSKAFLVLEPGKKIIPGQFVRGRSEDHLHQSELGPCFQCPLLARSQGRGGWGGQTFWFKILVASSARESSFPHLSKVRLSHCKFGCKYRSKRSKQNKKQLPFKNNHDAQIVPEQLKKIPSITKQCGSSVVLFSPCWFVWIRDPYSFKVNSIRLQGRH